MNKIFLSLSLSLIISIGYSQLPNINLKDVNGVTKNLSKYKTHHIFPQLQFHKDLIQLLCPTFQQFEEDL